jgi:hypothetical protein
MADIGANAFATDIGPTQDNISTITTAPNGAAVSLDTNLNPVGIAGKDVSTADIAALIERARITLMDYFADNLR